MARANSLPAPNVKSAAVSWLSRINPSKGCESTCSLTAYGREFKHLAPARYDGFSWSINGFGADADFARDNFVWPSASRQRNHKAIENPSKCRGVGGGFHACRQQGPPIRRADTPLRRLRHGANLSPHRRPCRGDGLYGARFAAGGWLTACLWSCLAYFAIDGAIRANAALQGGKIWTHIFSFSGLIDLVAVGAVPVALLCGVPSATAWLLASLWVLKLAQDSPGFEQLQRVFVVEAKVLASVFALFLIVLFISSAAMYVIERHAQPTAFNSMPQALWWAVVKLTTTGYGDKVPITDLGRLLGGFVMICGIATFGLSTGILATGFAAETRRRNFIRTWDLVSKVPFFQSLDPAAITEITHLLRLLEVPERTAIIRRGKIGDCMYFIAGGEVQVDVKPTPVRL